ncbi:MAG: hypothetical protein F4Z14_08760 [Gammaproteobacteria bacterium]|nr:hypothetical protein [Gammaproteobacteria bacterium]
MKLKPFIFIFSITTLILASITLMAQERERPAAARSLSADGLSTWALADIDEVREAAKETFKLLDANNNGSVTLDEIDILEELIDGEESLPAEDLAELRQRLNIVSRTFMHLEEEIDHFEIADTDHDGTLSESEFDLQEASIRTHILQLNLDSFDKDKNGGIEETEFTAHLDDVEDLDTDGDGTLSRAELRGIENQRLLQDIRVSSWQRQVRAERRASGERQAQQDESGETKKKDSR